jgi:hypothetical protein
VFEYDGSAEAQSSLLTLFAAGTPPKFIKDKRSGVDESVYNYLQTLNVGSSNWFKYGVVNDNSNNWGYVLRFNVPSDYSTITTLNKSEKTIDGNNLNISWARAADFPSASTKLLGHIIQAIGTDYAKKTEVPTPDGTTITSNNGVWSAVGGGGGSSLPTDPAADGTYFLSNTISSGVSTKAWVSIPAASGNSF